MIDLNRVKDLLLMRSLFFLIFVFYQQFIEPFPIKIFVDQ